MKLRSVSSVFGFGVTALAVAGFGHQMGCSSSTASSVVGQPPPPPTGPATTSTKVETFAIQTLLLGEAPRAGGPASNSAWKSYGYNLDGLVTTETSTNVCTLAAGAPKINQIDGNNGIDNSFGSVILPIIQSAASLPTPSQTISTYIANGNFTIQIQVTGLDDTPTQNATGLSGQIFASGAYPNGKPAFDMTTDWPVNPQLLNDYTNGMCPSGGCLVSSGSTITFSQNGTPSAYISNGTFVSGNLATGGITVSLSLVFEGVALTLAINHAVITFDHTSPAVAGNGTIAGVIDTNELITGLQSVAGRISTSLCGSAFTGIAQQIMQASDILDNGTNMAGTACTGISIGLGFTGALVANPDMVSSLDAAVPPDPCATDGGNSNDTGTGNETGSDASDAAEQ